MSALPDKSALRILARGRRDALSPDVRGPATVAIIRGVTDIIAAVRPSTVACYSAIRGEVDPSGVLEWALAHEIVVALPAVADEETIVFRKVSAGEDLVSGGFGTRAPPASALPVVPDLIVVPVVGFDRRGMRLGYGRGFYDRAITGLRQRGASPVLLGAAFAVQEVSAIPVESHDIGLDWVVTERETLDFRPIG